MNRLFFSIGVSLLVLLLVSPALACTGCWGPFPRGTNFKFLRMRIQNDASSYPRASPVTPIPDSKGEAVPRFTPQKPIKNEAKKRSKAKNDDPKSQKQKP